MIARKKNNIMTDHLRNKDWFNYSNDLSKDFMIPIQTDLQLQSGFLYKSDHCFYSYPEDEHKPSDYLNFAPLYLKFLQDECSTFFIKDILNIVISHLVTDDDVNYGLLIGNFKI